MALSETENHPEVVGVVKDLGRSAFHAFSYSNHLKTNAIQLF